MSRACLSQHTPTRGARLVNRLKNTNLDKFHTLCKMHLSFLLDLPGSSLEDILGGTTANATGTPGGPLSSGTATPTTDRLAKSHFLHFGKRRLHKDYNNSPALSQGTIDVLLPLVEYLGNEENVKQEGLFRKSGHIGRQKILREKLLGGENVDVELREGVYSAHDCANVLKTSLSELPEPLLSDRLYLAYCQVSEMAQVSKQLQTLQLLLQLLPAENLLLLRRLLTLLQKTANEPSSKMTSETLGTLFAPHLLMPRKMSGSELQAVTADLTKTAAFMIENASELFKVPSLLLADIATYWAQMEEGTESPFPDTPETPRARFKRAADPADIPIHTTVSFTDRQASHEAAQKTDTQMALAELYAHVSSMPESAKKRKYLHKFHKANYVALGASPVHSLVRHKRTRSVGDSIKKLVHKGHKRQNSNHMLQMNPLEDSQCSYKKTPVNTATPHTEVRKARVVKILTSEFQENVGKVDANVHIVDMKENADPKQVLSAQTHKRKSPFVEPAPSPIIPACSTLFLSPIASFAPLGEDTIVKKTPLMLHAKKRMMSDNHTRQTI